MPKPGDEILPQVLHSQAQRGNSVRYLGCRGASLWLELSGLSWVFGDFVLLFVAGPRLGIFFVRTLLLWIGWTSGGRADGIIVGGWAVGSLSVGFPRVTLLSNAELLPFVAFSMAEVLSVRHLDINLDQEAFIGLVGPQHGEKDLSDMPSNSPLCNPQ